MTVLHILSDSNIGGAGVWLLTLCRNRNKDVEIITALPEGAASAEYLKELGIKTFELNVKRDKSFSSGDILKYLICIKMLKPDIVHTHGSLSGRIAAKLAGIKRVFYTKHTMNEPRQGFKRFLALILENWLNNMVIAVSSATRVNLIENGIKAQNIHVIMSGVDRIPIYEEEVKKKLRSKFGIEEGAFVVGIIGRLSKVKSHRTFLDACAKIDGIEGTVFFIAGEGEEEANIRDYADKLGIYAQCVFAGHTEPDIIYNIIDVCVSASLKETFGLTLCEAMSCGIPVISTRSGGPQEIIDENSGILVDIGDSDAISKAIEELKNNKKKYKEIAANGFSRWERAFSAKRFANDIYNLYRGGKD